VHTAGKDGHIMVESQSISAAAAGNPAHSLAQCLTDIAAWAFNAQKLGALLSACSEDFDGADAAAREFDSKVVAVMEAIDRNLTLIGERALAGADEAACLARQ
jgi:hypothetical protein